MYLTANEKGRKAEQTAEQYFTKHKLNYIDVRNNPEYWKTDIDYIVDELGTVEVKYNYYDALRGMLGQFIRFELYMNNEPKGWWFFTTADYFLFFNEFNNGLLIKNDYKLSNYINDAIKNGNHSNYGNNRFDTIVDIVGSNYKEVTLMRAYVTDLINNNIEITKIVNRKII